MTTRPSYPHTSTSGTFDLQAYRDTATIAIMVNDGRDQREMDDKSTALLRVVRNLHLWLCAARQA
jgi:hypothetical protein